VSFLPSSHVARALQELLYGESKDLQPKTVARATVVKGFEMPDNLGRQAF